MARVMIVDDAAFMHKVISDILNEDEDITVVATARNGLDTIYGDMFLLLTPNSLSNTQDSIIQMFS